MERVIIFHSQSQLESAFQAASDLNCPLHVQSAPYAAKYLGVLMLSEMVAANVSKFDSVKMRFTIDCLDDAALACAAIRVGLDYIRVRLPDALQVKVNDGAAHQRATIVNSKFDYLDLEGIRNPYEACVEWLKPKQVNKIAPKNLGNG